MIEGVKKRLEELERKILEAQAAWKTWGEEQNQGDDDDGVSMIAQAKKSLKETERKTRQMLEGMKERMAKETERVSSSPLAQTSPPTNRPIPFEHSVRIVIVRAISVMRQEQFVMLQKQSADTGVVEEKYSDGEEEEEEEATVLGAGVEKISRQTTAT